MINSVQSTQINFGSYQSVLKTLFKKGKLPNVKKGIYGDLIDVNNVSLEHLLPASEGGTTNLSNLALASKRNNNKRGNQPLNIVLNWSMINEYLDQFTNIFIPNKFNGNKYKKMIKQTCINLGIKPNKNLNFFI